MHADRRPDPLNLATLLNRYSCLILSCAKTATCFSVMSTNTSANVHVTWGWENQDHPRGTLGTLPTTVKVHKDFSFELHYKVPLGSEDWALKSLPFMVTVSASWSTLGRCWRLSQFTDANSQKEGSDG